MAIYITDSTGAYVSVFLLQIQHKSISSVDTVDRRLPIGQVMSSLIRSWPGLHSVSILILPCPACSCWQSRKQLAFAAGRVRRRILPASGQNQISRTILPPAAGPAQRFLHTTAQVADVGFHMGG